MRVLACLAASCLLGAAAFAAAPPARVPPEVLKLIDQLGEEDEAKRLAAEKKLEALGEDAIPILRRAARTHADVDVQLRATVLASAIQKKFYGEVHQFTGSADIVTAFAVSPDGKRMVSGCWGDGGEHVARVWDVKTGKELFQLTGHGSGVICMDWSRDGKRILTGARDGIVRLWDAEAKGKPLKAMPARTRWIHAVLFTPDGKKAVSCGYEREVIVWDLEAAKEIRRNQDNTDSVRGLAWLPGGKQVVSAGFDGSVRILDIETGKQVRKMSGSHTGGAWFVAVSPDGKRIASCGSDKMVRLWDSATGKQLKEFAGHTQATHGVAISRCGKRLLSAGESVRLWDIDSGKEVERMGEGAKPQVSCVAFTPDDRHAMFSSDRTLTLWKLRK